jgi:hypothetical protein
MEHLAPGYRGARTTFPKVLFTGEAPSEGGASPFTAKQEEEKPMVPIAIAGTGLGIIGLLVVIVLVILVVRAL